MICFTPSMYAMTRVQFAALQSRRRASKRLRVAHRAVVKCCMHLQVLKTQLLAQRFEHVKQRRREAGVPLAYQLTYCIADNPVKVLVLTTM